MIPRHIAVIMDGNGRWAQQRLLPRSAGHRAGMKRMIALCDHAFGSGVECMTLYALSTENFSRPQEELDGLFRIFREYFTENVAELKGKGVRLRVIGQRSLLPSDICTLISDAEEKTREGRCGTVVLALGYGGRQEILSAVNAAVARGKAMSMDEFSALLDTADLPDPDLLIRTGREKRLSNFLLWQSAYTELYFSDKLFPAFTDADFDRAIENFSARQRRFGGLGKTIKEGKE